MSQTVPVTVFFSYSHKDEVLRDELAKHLKLLERTNVIDAWHDRAIPVGSEWDKGIKKELNEADIILLLISSDFLASDYIWDVEVKTAMARHEAKDAVVVPIVLRECEWFDAPFGKLQGLPKDAKPVTSYQNIDEPFTFIAKHIKKAAKAIRVQKSIEQEGDSPLAEAPEPKDIPATMPSPLPDNTNRKLELEGLKDNEKLLIEKRNTFQQQATISSDAAQKFSLKKQIEEIDKELAEVRGKIGEISA